MAARGIRRIIELALDAASARRMRDGAQDALRRGTDPTTAKSNLREVERGITSISGAAGRLRGALSGVRGMLASIGAGIGFGAVFKFLADANREAQSLQAQLKVSEGSAEAAGARFAAIQDFAKRTPFEVSEITAAFLDLRTTGIEPTAAMLTSFGDIASSRGKGLRDFTKAVQDALTGEMERLKEFGIVSKQQGNQVQFTFNGTTTTVQRTRGAILEYLQSVGEMKGIQGSMAEQMKTLNGIISNIWDNLNNLAVAAGEEGAASAMGTLLGSVQDFTSGLANNRGEIRFWVGAIGGAVKFVGSVVAGTIQSVVGLAGLAVGAIQSVILAVQYSFTASLNDIKSNLNSILDLAHKHPLIAQMLGLGGLAETDRFALSNMSGFAARFARLKDNLVATAGEIGRAFTGVAQSWAEMATAFDRSNTFGGPGGPAGEFGAGGLTGGDTAIGGGAGGGGRGSDAERRLAELRAGQRRRRARIPGAVGGTELGGEQVEATMYRKLEEAHQLHLMRQQVAYETYLHRREEAWLQSNSLLIDITHGVADEFAAAWGRAFEMLMVQGATFGSFMEQVARGTAEALLGGLSQYARGEQQAEIARVFAALAKAYSNPPLAPMYLKSAATHGLAAAAWGVLAGGVGAAANSAGGRGGGGAYSSRDPGLNTAESARRTAPEIIIYVDGIDPSNPRHQALALASVQQAQERYGSTGKVTIRPRGPR